MPFVDVLKEYLVALECSIRALARESGVPATTLARYCSGERSPKREAEALTKLACGIASLAAKQGLEGIDEAEVLQRLTEAASSADDEASRVLADNLNALMDALHIRSADLARAISYDASYLSRIRQGQRHPAFPRQFADGVGLYVARRCRTDAQARLSLADCMGLAPSSSFDESEAACAVALWLLENANVRANPAKQFLASLNDFDFAMYTTSLRFDGLAPASAEPAWPPRSKTFMGVEGLRAAEVEFLKCAAFGRASEPVFMYSTMPMEDLAQDADFARQWMGGLAMVLKRGCTIQIIHDVSRPFNEMMLGLQSWIPLYMTGQIEPYYLPGEAAGAIRCALRTCGDAALVGEGVAGARDHDRYTLSTKGPEVDYCRTRANDLLKCAKPLMEVFREDRAEAFARFFEREAGVGREVRRLLSTPPLHAMDDDCLEDIIAGNGLGPSDANHVRRAVAMARRAWELITHKGRLVDAYAPVSPEEFGEQPLNVPLASVFMEHSVTYTYEQYLRHVESARAFAKRHGDAYELHEGAKSAFRNIQIALFEGRCALVSKLSSPAIHFAIWHPKLCEALEGLVADADGNR